MSTAELSRTPMHSISRSKLHCACKSRRGLAAKQGDCDSLAASRHFKLCRRSAPLEPSSGLASMAALVTLFLLTTWNCVHAVEAQDLIPQAPAAARRPYESFPATDIAVASLPAPSSQSSSAPADSFQFAGPHSRSAPADSFQFGSPQSDSVPANSFQPGSPQFDSPSADNPEVVSPVSPKADSPESSSPGIESIAPTTVSAVFVFGDSLVDPGNNNYIPSLAKANILYNGIDFPGGPTGRFCNGRTVVDILCDILGVPYPPAFLNPQTNGSKVLHGVNYASGAGGILDATGANFITYFQGKTVPQLEAQLGKDGASTLLATSLVAIVIGSNDFINNYLLLDTNATTKYSSAQFNILVLNSFSRQLTALYNSGFRMFYVSGIGPIGCIPHQLALAGQPDCVYTVNEKAEDFNVLAKSLLQDLNAALPDAMFLFGDSYRTVTDLINNPQDYGFTVVNEGCCGGGLYRAQSLCQPAAALCSNRAKYVFWDAYHTTEASNLVLARGIFNGGKDAVSPINLRQMLSRRL